MKSEVAAIRDADPKTSLTEEAYRVLKQEILANRMPPGFRALEPELAQRLGMSRTPVREAVIRLRDEGLVEVVAASGDAGSSRRTGGHEGNLRDSDRFGIRGRRLVGVDQAEPGEVAAADRGVVGDGKRAWRRKTAKVGRLPTISFTRALLDLCPNRRMSNFIALLFDQAHRRHACTRCTCVNCPFVPPPNTGI